MNPNEPRPRTDSLASGTSPRIKTFSLITGLLGLRIYNALSLRTFFQPDEYFQALEPAWGVAFGKDSGAWITWEWRESLRSSLHPILFSRVYKATTHFCDSLHVSLPVRAEILIASPKLLQALFAACTDLLTYRLACKVYGTDSPQARTALVLTLLSPWQWFCSVRTFSNSLETTLTVLALCLWPWDWFLPPLQSTKITTAKDAERKMQMQTSDANVPPSLYASLVAAAIACILRPTNLIIWASICVALSMNPANYAKLMKLALAGAVSGTAMLAVSIGMDRSFYREWVFPPLKFLQFNVVQSLSTFYGTNRLDYYFTEALYLLLTSTLPFAVVGLWQSMQPHPKQIITKGGVNGHGIRCVLALAILTTLLTLSVIAHKEVRFIFPLLPMFHVLAARPLVAFLEPVKRRENRYRGFLVLVGLAMNLTIGYYASYIHQRGVIDVMHYLRHEHETHYLPRNTINRNMTVGFLMPCHSTPWRSHLVYPEIDAWALTCEPPLGLSYDQRKNYTDEADLFYAAPDLWFDMDMQRRGKQWPEYLVFFDQLTRTIKSRPEGVNYEVCWRGFNTHWHDDWRRQGDVVVWCKRRL